MEFSIPFSGRSHAYTDEEIAVVVEAMQSAVPLTQGAYLKGFEAAFADYVGADNCFAVCNATAALHLAAQLCQFSHGDEVIIPAHTFTASAYPFAKQGAKLIWADIDLESRVVTAEHVDRCISPRTKAIVVTHLYGYVVEMQPILDLAAKHGLLVVEDAAQSLGSRLDGRLSGTYADFGVYSFHSHKNMTTLGEGGMLRVRDAELAHLVPLLRHNGHSSYAEGREEYWKPAMGNVEMPVWNGQPVWPSNYCLGEVECALGTKLLERVDEMNRDRRRRAIAFMDSFGEDSLLRFHRVDTSRHNYHLLAAQVMDGQRDRFMRTMADKHGIQCVVQYMPLYRYPFYVDLGLGAADCPNTDAFFDNMVSFPFHHSLTDREISRIAEAAATTLGE